MSKVPILRRQISLVGRNLGWPGACLIIMLVMAALIRRDEIRAPGHLIEREYNSAIFARAFFFQNNNRVGPWRKDAAVATREQAQVLEPPVTEYLVSLIYRAAGHEELWYARYVTSAFWLIGGVFLYKIARAMLSVIGALLTVGYYLFVPMGVIISRSFQPDSLMMMMFLASLFSVMVYFERPSWHRLILTGIIAGITLLLRPLVVFILLGAFSAMSVSEEAPGRRLLNKRLLVFCIVSLVFPLAYYGYGIYIAGFLGGQAELSFRPYLLSRWQFWLGWFCNAVSVAGPTAFILALFGFFSLREKFTRNLIVGMSIGYFMFGLVFTYHVYSHPYYHIQLFPIIGICAAQFLDGVVNMVQKSLGKTWWIPTTAALLVILYFSYRDVRATLYTEAFEDPQLAKEIGEVVHHSAHTVLVAYHYGVPLQYYGEFAGVPWPSSIDDPFYRRPDAQEQSIQDRLDALSFSPEYYVVTNFPLFESKHRDLQAYLLTNCPAVVRTTRYLIFGACQGSTAKKN